MKATVSTLYRKGRSLPPNKVGVTVAGDLDLITNRHPITGLVNYEANVLDDTGMSLLPSLRDAACVSISSNGFRLRGIIMDAGREMAQEWWCRPSAHES